MVCNDKCRTVKFIISFAQPLRRKAFHFLFYRTDTIVKSAIAEFALGNEFIENTIDGRKMKTTFTIVVITDESGMEFNALLQAQIDSSDRRIQVLRFIDQDGMLQVRMTVGDTIGRALFERA